MRAFRLVHTDDLRERIDNERLDAAQREHDRHERHRRVTTIVLHQCADELRQMVEQPFAVSPENLRTVADTLDGVLEVLRGEWLRSPRAMAEERKR